MVGSFVVGFRAAVRDGGVGRLVVSKSRREYTCFKILKK